MWVGHWLETQRFALEWRYKIYQWKPFAPREPFIQRTVVVLIGDEEYWKGELARRVPTKRDYLAKLVRALDAADPAVIALDFDLRSQTPDGSFIQSQDYANETAELLNAVKDVSKDRWVVLARTIRWDGEHYVAEADVYDQFDFEGGNVLTGYIYLPSDYRKLPLSVPLKDGTRAYSFAEAIVRATNEQALRPVEHHEELPYTSYLDANAFEQLSPTEVINQNPEALRKIRHNTVIVGAGWSSRAYGRGGPVDTFMTPVGPLRGAVMHANYVEALLDNRTAKPWNEWVLRVIEIIITCAVAVIFVLLIGHPWLKLVSILLLIGGLLLFSWFSWLNLGLFYDFFVPVVLVIAHAVYEQVREWQKHNKEPAEVTRPETQEATL